jgi:hypothetical protein
VKALTDCDIASCYCEREGLGHIGGVNVMECLHSKIGEQYLVSDCQIGEYLWIEIARWIDGPPARADEVTWMQNRRRESARTSLVQEILLDRGLPAAVIAEGTPWRIFGSRYLYTVAVNPDGSAVKEMPHTPAQGFYQLAGALDRVAR